MSEMLFNVPVCESPRLRWLKKRDVKTWHFPDIGIGDEDEYGQSLWPWVADTSHGCSPDRTGPAPWTKGAATEAEAIAELARWQGWLLWNEESA